MSSNPLIRQVPVGIVAIFTLLTGTIVGQQVVPASRTPQPPAPKPLSPIPPVAGSSQAPPAPGARPLTPLRRQAEQDDQMEALIAQALDQKTDLSIKNTPIREAFDLLGNQTGITIEVEPGTVALLPYGSETKVSATIQGRPLRESLAALLRPIGLRFDVENRRVLIRASRPLRRCVERVTWNELGLLEKLASAPWSDEVAKSLKFQFRDSPSSANEMNRETLLRLAAGVGQGTAAQVLEQATEHYGWTWYPSRDLIVVLPKTRQFERQLEKRISADFSQTSLQDALLDLAETARVPLHIEPGALASLSPMVSDRFSLSVVNTPIRQVLELIAGQTGLAYYIDTDGVRITSNPLSSSSPTTRPSDLGNVSDAYKMIRANGVVGTIKLPTLKDGREISIYIRRGDLPPDVSELVDQVIQGSPELIRAAVQATSRPHD